MAPVLAAQDGSVWLKDAWSPSREMVRGRVLNSVLQDDKAERYVLGSPRSIKMESQPAGQPGQRAHQQYSRVLGNISLSISRSKLTHSVQ